MGLGDRLRRLDDNAYSDLVHDQATAPFTWWLTTAVGLLALGLGIAESDSVAVGIGTGLTLIGALFSVLARRRDRRNEDTRRERTEMDMAERRHRRQGE